MLRPTLIRSLGMSLLFAALATDAGAAITEPNGINVPCTIPCITPPDPNYRETTPKSFFNAKGEPLNALTDASTAPGVFQPLCNFKATLVLSQSQANGGIAWYNVPADPMSA